jgi:hypothetical protein
MRNAGLIVLIAACACQGGSDDDPAGDADAAVGEPDATARIGDGTLQTWSNESAMPHARANHCATVIGDRVVVVGGNYRPQGAADFITSDQIHVAQIDSDGSMSAWSLAGTTPSPVRECNAASDGRRLLLFGGLWDSEAHAGVVHAAELGADGMLEAWTSAGSLPEGAVILSSKAWVSDDSLHVVQGLIPTEGDKVQILTAPLGDTLGAWKESTVMAPFRGRPQIAASSSAVYLAGGYLTGNEVVTTGRGAGITRDGADSGFDLTELPAATAFGDAVVAGGHVFVLGGRGMLVGGAYPAVWSAPIEADGSVGAWTEQMALPEARTNLRAVVAGDVLVVTGGGNDGPGLDTVFVTRWN